MDNDGGNDTGRVWEKLGSVWQSVVDDGRRYDEAEVMSVQRCMRFGQLCFRRGYLRSAKSRCWTACPKPSSGRLLGYEVL